MCLTAETSGLCAESGYSENRINAGQKPLSSKSEPESSADPQKPRRAYVYFNKFLEQAQGLHDGPMSLALSGLHSKNAGQVKIRRDSRGSVHFVTNAFHSKAPWDGISQQDVM